MEQAKAYSCVSGERSDSLNFTAPLAIISVISFYYLFYFRLHWPVKHPACTGVIYGKVALLSGATVNILLL